MRHLWLFLLLAAAQASAVTPQPDIKINGSDSTIYRNLSDTVTVTIAMRSNDFAGKMADWLVYAETSFGIFHYGVQNGTWAWQAGMGLSYQGALFDFDSLPVLTMSLPPGTYLLHFGVDMNVNGQLDPEIGFRDSVRVHVPQAATGSSQGVILGRAVDLAGEPIDGAVIVSDTGGIAASDSQGWFGVAAQLRPQWVTVNHPEYISRTRVARPGSPVLMRMTPDNGNTLSFHFGGDVMFGRRFYDPNSDGDITDARLAPNASVAEHLALLQPIKTLLENAHLSSVNLETPLTNEAYFNLTLPPPSGYHPDKDFVFGSHPNSALALKQAGVDVVDLGNNHLYDYLEAGITETEQALLNADMGFFGAGLNEDQAWLPAVKIIRGQSVALIGCTTINGSRYPLNYVASDEEQKGGAANCSASRIRDSISTAKKEHDVVIMMVHGGFEYQRSASEAVSSMSNAAREAGATMIINHHPHVVGGFDWQDDIFTAWTLGNILFDQTVWPTLQSYLLGVHVQDGKVIRAYAEPMMVEDFLPKGLTGGLAESVTRIAAGTAPGPWVMENGAMETDFAGRAEHIDTVLPITTDSTSPFLLKVPRNHSIQTFDGDGEIRLGRDLLWVGDFEDEDADAERLESALWRLDGADKEVASAFAYSGEGGGRIQRDWENSQDVLLTPLHRILIDAGTPVSVTGMVRVIPFGNAVLQLSWYPDTRGGSSSRSIFQIGGDSQGQWREFRADAVAPDDAIAVGLFLKLSPPTPAVGSLSADFDQLRLIAWEEPGVPFSPLYDHALISGSGKVTLRQTILPGADGVINNWE